jgi:hypothetical protein
LSDFTAAGTQVFVVVPHERCRVRWWAKRAATADPSEPADGKRVDGKLAAGQLVYLADPGFWVSSMYGVAFQMQIHTDVSNTPGTFLVDKQGILRWAHRGQGKTNYRDRPTVRQTLAKVRELADTD